MVITPKIQSEFDEQIGAFFKRAKSKADAEKQLAKHCDDMLAQLPEMVTILNEYPVYAGIAFYGKMQIVNKKLIARLSPANTPASVAIAAIRAEKALKIAATAKQGWDFLLKNNEEALWSAIQLNSKAIKAANDHAEEADEDGDSEDYEEKNEEDEDES